jgi:hypothetical protein
MDSFNHQILWVLILDLFENAAFLNEQLCFFGLHGKDETDCLAVNFGGFCQCPVFPWLDLSPKAAPGFPHGQLRASAPAFVPRRLPAGKRSGAINN